MPVRVLPNLVLDAARTLIRVPSVNPALAPGEGLGEQAVAEAAVQWLMRHGVRAWLDTLAPGRANAVASIGDGPGPTLVFCAHLDTVGTAGMTIPPFDPRVEDGRLYGRGSCDMKGSAGAIMATAVALQERHPRGRVLLALVADEEDASLGAHDFVQRYAADACIVTEPSNGTLVLGHKGFVWAEVVTTGVAAHGSRFDVGECAIAKMAPIIAGIDAFDRKVLRRRVHPLVGPASMHCGLVSGGIGLSTYAPECRLQVERRTIPGETPALVIEELRDIVEGCGAEARVELRLDRPPLLCDRDAPIAHAVRDAAEARTGAVPEETGVAYWMDAAVFAAAGIQTVNFGPAGDGAHAAVEWVDVESLSTLADVLADAAHRFLDCPA